jgi:acyl dehydratase
MGVSLGKILHGEQGYTYHQPVCAGETVTVCSRISDIYDKKGGALEFIVRDSRVTNASGELAAEFRSVIVVRN